MLYLLVCIFNQFGRPIVETINSVAQNFIWDNKVYKIKLKLQMLNCKIFYYEQIKPVNICPILFAIIIPFNDCFLIFVPQTLA